MEDNGKTPWNIMKKIMGNDVKNGNETIIKQSIKRLKFYYTIYNIAEILNTKYWFYKKKMLE